MEFNTRLFVFFFVASAITVSCFGQYKTVKSKDNGRVPFGIGKLTYAEYALLKDSVKYIVGPRAKVTPEILQYAESQPGIPRNFHEMMGYMPFYYSQAETEGLSRVENGYNEGIENPANARMIVDRRATQWWINNGYVSQQTSDNKFQV